MKLTASARCLVPGCPWPAPEGIPAVVDRAAEKHTTAGGHPTSVTATPDDLPASPRADAGPDGAQCGPPPGVPARQAPGGAHTRRPGLPPKTPAGGKPEPASSFLAGLHGARYRPGMTRRLPPGGAR